MKFDSIKEKVKEVCVKIGKRNFIIFGAMVLVVGAIAVNLVVFSRADKDGHDYDSPAGMGGSESDTEVSADTPNSSDSYFSSVQVSRRRTRDEAIEVLQAVVDDKSATEAAKNEALSEINKLAGVMATEANIELNGEIYAWKYLKGMYSDSPQNRLEFWAYSASAAHVDRLWEDSPSRYPIYFIVGLLGLFWGK